MSAQLSKTLIERIAWQHVATFNKANRANRNIDTVFNFGELGKMSMRKLVEMFGSEIAKSLPKGIEDYGKGGVQIISEAKVLELLRNPKNPKMHK